MIFTMPSHQVAKRFSEELAEILDKIFNERFAMAIDIRMVFSKDRQGKALKSADEKIKKEIEEIVDRTTLEIEKKNKIREDVKKEQHVEPRKKEGKGKWKKTQNKDVLYGRDFEEEEMPIEQILGEMGEVVIKGKIIRLDTREIRNEKTIIMFDVTDFTDTITVKMFARNEQREDILENLKTGAFIKLKGVTSIDKFDSELTIGSVTGIKKIGDFTSARKDTSPVKRVELHCHTKMSDMDGVSDVKEIIHRAKNWGHPAIAITDHGAVQSLDRKSVV